MIQWFPLAACVFAAWGVQQGSTPVQEDLAVRSGPTFEFEEEWAEELVPLTQSPGGLRTRVDVGRSPVETELRLCLEGARPLSGAWVELGTLEGESLSNVRRQALRTDAEGRASLRLPGPIPCGLGARFVAASAAGPCFLTAATILPGGGPLAISGPQRGDVVITEIMKDPTFVSDAHGEWFEIQNVSNHMVNIAGWKITDQGSNAHTILNGVQAILLSPGQVFVLGNDIDPLTNGGVHIDYKYSNFTLGNGADSILLTARRGDLVDQVDYDDGILWPDVAGKTLSLHVLAGSAVLNDDPTNWCPGKTFLGGGNTDMGTPGMPNDLCP